MQRRRKDQKKTKWIKVGGKKKTKPGGRWCSTWEHWLDHSAQTAPWSHTLSAERDVEVREQKKRKKEKKEDTNNAKIILDGLAWDNELHWPQVVLHLTHASTINKKKRWKTYRNKYSQILVKWVNTNSASSRTCAAIARNVIAKVQLSCLLLNIAFLVPFIRDEFETIRRH